MNLILLIKMNIRQFLSNYFIVCVLFTVTPLILWLGYAFSSEGKILKYNVGIEISERSKLEYVKEVLEESGRFSCTVLNKNLILEKAVRHKYVAIVTMEKDRTFKVRSTENQVIASEIRRRLGVSKKDEFYVGAFKKALGFLIVFIMMTSKLLQGGRFRERENGILIRLLSGKVSSKEYLASQFIANFIEVFFPVVLSTVIYSFTFKGISLWPLDNIVFFEIIISILASSFSFFIFYSFREKMTIEFVSSLLILVTSILGGCLIDFRGTNQVVEMVRNVLPQKVILNMLENNGWSNYIIFCCWVLGFIIVGTMRGSKIVCKK